MSLLDITKLDDLREQALVARRIRHHRLWAWGVAIAMLLLGLGDFISTEMALLTGANEANPLVKAVQDALGVFWFIPKMLFHAVIATMVLWYPNKPTLCLLTLTSVLITGIVWNNFHIALYGTSLI